MRSPLKWVGGKSRLIKLLLPFIPEHKRYVEVFGGAGWLLFAKEQSQVEVLNDFDDELMNFWNVIKQAPVDFIAGFEYELVSRSRYVEYKAKFLKGDYKDNVERARIFFYLVRAGFAANMDNPNFGTSCQTRNGLKVEQVREIIEAASERLKNVTIENQSFEKMFWLYDSPETFFFLDSPYRNTAGYRVGKFTDEHYELLAECCKNAQGKWLYTINDDPLIRELFKDFCIMDHEVYYCVAKADQGRRKFKELIIANYDPN